MSRSVKKLPIVKSGGIHNVSKRHASKTVRASGQVGNGSNYKKLFESWDIAEYYWKCFSDDDIINSDYGKRSKNVKRLIHKIRGK